MKKIFNYFHNTFESYRIGDIKIALIKSWQWPSSNFSLLVNTGTFGEKLGVIPLY